MSQFILALDQGTTSSRAIVFGRDGRSRGVAQREFPQIYPQPGHVEHDPLEIWNSQFQCSVEALAAAGARSDQIAAIGIANQRETTILWDRVTGLPIANAVVWQSRVTEPICRKLKADGLEPLVRERTGLVLDPYFSGTKIGWLLDQVPGSRARAERGEILFGTVDTWLLWKLSGGRVHATDPSNASRTLLFNIHTLGWDEDLLRILNVPRAMLPDVRPSSGSFGETDPALFGRAIPLCGVAGDQQAATFGQACFEPGSAKNTYGTGCFLLMNTGEKPVASQNGLLTTVGWTVNGKTTYCLEGAVFIAGAVVQWLRDGLGLIGSSAEVEQLALRVPDTGGVYFVPAFVGLGAPWWNPNARGTIVGITRGTQREHIARAALESIAWQTLDVLQAMQRDSGVPLAQLKVDGGAAKNDLLMQFQADLLQVPVRRPTVAETTALGAAYLAGLAVGYWNGPADIQANWALDREFTSTMPTVERETRHHRWKQAVERSTDWA
ncbi:MAG: glycerol kinase GlpK [Planctomycetota bacterium]|nr:glycerol kinase GlpK [Planctomycetota bacterium]